MLVYAILIAYSMIWGFSFVGTTTALETLTEFEVLAARWSLGATIIVLLSLIGVFKVNLKGKPVFKMLLCALVQPVIYGITETYGMAITTASEAAIMIALSPILSLLISTLFLRMKIDGVTKFAIVLAFAGVLCTVVFAEGFTFGAKLTGYVILFICASSSAVFCILSNKLSADFTSIERTLIMTVCGSVFFNVMVLFESGNLGYVKTCITDGRTFGAIFFLGFGCTFVCYVLCNYALSKLPAHIVTTVQGNLITLVGAISGIIINGDPWGLYTVIGLVMMMTGVVLVNRPVKNKSCDAEKDSRGA